MIYIVSKAAASQPRACAGETASTFVSPPVAASPSGDDVTLSVSVVIIILYNTTIQHILVLCSMALVLVLYYVIAGYIKLFY